MPPESYFTDDSMVRRVHREFVVGLAGPRTLLMQATHPVAFAGFFAHTGALDEPYERLARTAQVMDAITSARARRPTALTRRVRAMHRRVRGELPSPPAASRPARPTRADDPELLLWILAAIVDSSLLVYGKYVRRLSPRRARRLLAGLQAHRPPVRPRRRQMPDTIEDFDAYMRGDARRAATSTSRRRPASWRSRSSCARRCRCRCRPLLELANQITVGLLPREIRRGYGLRGTRCASVALHGGAEYVQAASSCRCCRTGCG